MNTTAQPPTNHPAERPIEEIETEICSLAGQIAAATARFLTLLAEFDARRGWAGWQLHSAAHWLSWKAGISLHTAREQVRVANAVTELPRIAQAFAEGRVSYSKVRALTRVATPHTEESLLRIALQSPAAHLDRLVRGLVKQARTPDDTNNNTDTDRARGRWFYDDDGYLVVMARFRPEDGARFLAALTRAECERTRTDDDEPDRTAPAPSNPVPAMVAMAETLCTAESPVVSPAADVLVHVGPDGAPLDAPHAHLDDGPGLDSQTLETVLCTAAVRLIRHGRLGPTIAWDRSRRRPSRTLLRQLLIRDRCCTVPGCGRTRFLHAHHVVYYSRGGPTDLDNLTLLCGEHHRALHDGLFTITADGNQRFTFADLDGRRIDYAPLLSGDVDDLSRRYHHIDPDAVTADWSGEPLDASFATDVLLRNWDLEKRRRDTELATAA
ncbi:DUF222 domain-containing protein [Antrihabitans sp. YC3-6]|uniref:DUF222 domain-containing protein n=1 Tax=Antrihabitans stalagmiti TaxID=2799499 RepID=A0A934U0R6_9NOCA|nr:HNH endonuclease signature motif containing protein [Antrihabitans stalagmiti]MBJ8337622.1 DUF222 domain-containing protein [Antrihabitans stalagmiti]